MLNHSQCFLCENALVDCKTVDKTVTYMSLCVCTWTYGCAIIINIYLKKCLGVQAAIIGYK